MSQDINLLHKYAALFRELINTKVQGSDKPIKAILRLNVDSDWNFLTAAMDIVDDASAAVDHVIRFGLSGPTKYNEMGEKYLRLYGLLSATYIQQQSVLTIHRIMNVPNLKDAARKFEQLDIRNLRHKLSSHGTDFQNRETGRKEAYVPLRFDLEDTTVTAVNNSALSAHQKVNLSEAIQKHVELMIDSLDRITEKSISTIFKGRPAEIFSSELSTLRIEKAGGLVVKGSGGPTIVVTFAES